MAVTLAELLTRPPANSLLADAAPLMEHGLRVVRDVRLVTPGVPLAPRAGDLLIVCEPMDTEAVGALAYTIAECQGAGVAGLMASKQGCPPTAPGSLADAAHENDVPLILVTHVDDWDHMIHSLRQTVIDSQLADARAAERVHEAFTKLSTAEVSNGSPAHVLREVTRLTGCAAVLESFHHQVLAYDLGEADASVVFANWEVRSSRASSPQRTFFVPEERWLVTIVGALGEDWGRLILLVGTPPTHAQTLAVERAAAVMAMHRLAIRDIESIERHTHRLLLTSLLQGQADAELYRHLSSVGFQASGGHLVGIAVQPVWP